MSAGIFKSINTFTAEQFKESVSESSGNVSMYMTYSQITAWPDEANPPAANVVFSTEVNHWNGMIGGKRVTGDDIEHCVRRFDWEANTTFISFDGENPDLYNNTMFYVLTSDYNVYKCLSNNNNSISTVEPSSTNPNTITGTADGYIWKYMMTLNSKDKFRFLNDTYFPVSTLPSDDGSIQWDVQQNAVDGAIYDIRIDNAGNYTNSDNITLAISGDGSGANVYCNVNTVSNTIHTLTIDDYGTGYTNAIVTITGGGGTGGGVLRPILSPKNGHGSNPLYELGGKNLFINMRIRGTENGKLPIVNDIRQIGLIINPLILSSNNIISNTAFKQTTDLTLTGVSSNYEADEYVYQGASLDTATFYGRVVEYDSANSVLKLNRTQGSITADTIIGANTSETGFVVSESNPELERYTGEMIFIDNVELIERDENQTENFQIILGF